MGCAAADLSHPEKYYSHDNQSNVSTISLSQAMFMTKWRWIGEYILPVIVGCGLLGNLMMFAMIMYRKLHQKQAMFVVFAFIAFCDFVYIGCHPLFTLVDQYLTDKRILSNKIYCAAFCYVSISSSVCSVWLLVFANVYKVYVLFSPFNAFVAESVKLCRKVCGVITLCIFALYIHTIWLTQEKVVGVIMSNKTDEIVIGTGGSGNETLVIECYVQYKEQDHESMFDLYHVADMIAYSLAPGIILIITSILMYVSLYRNYKRHKLMTSEYRRVDNRYTQTMNTVLILFPISFMHIVCTLPLFVTKLLYTDDENQAVLLYVSLRLIDINHGFNVFIELAVSRSFRNSLFGWNK